MTGIIQPSMGICFRTIISCVTKVLDRDASALDQLKILLKKYIYMWEKSLALEIIFTA